MPESSALINPLLIIPPDSVEPLRLIPVLVGASIVPLLIMPPATEEPLVILIPEPSEDEPAIIVPLLVMPPAIYELLI